MTAEKLQILSKLRKQLSDMQAYKNAPITSGDRFGLVPVETCFPSKVFTTSTVHKFLAENAKVTASSEWNYNSTICNRE